MTADKLIVAIKETETMPELNTLRTEIAVLLNGPESERFTEVQAVFRTAKNRLNRVPYTVRQNAGW